MRLHDRCELVLSHVNFSYGHKQILYDISIDLAPGIIGILGPNGAGKTTLLNVVATFLKPTQGSISLNGVGSENACDRKQLRSLIGYLPQSFELMNASSVLKNVRYAAWARGVSWFASYRVAMKALEQVGLSNKKHALVSRISGGQRQRVGIACAIAANPAILILDEPTVGLDPEQRIDIRNFLKEYARNHIVIMSTHLVEDLAVVADRALILSQGRIVLDGTMNDIAAYADSDDQFMTAWESGYRHLLDLQRR